MGDVLTAKFNEQTHDRLTVRLDVYHQHWGDDPTSAHVHSWDFLQTQEQPFVRRTYAAPEWVPLSKIWGGVLESVGLVLIENRAGQSQQTNPTPEQGDEIAESIIEIGLPTDGMIVPFVFVRPRLFSVFEPVDPDRVYVRCCHRTPITVHAFPR